MYTLAHEDCLSKQLDMPTWIYKPLDNRLCHYVRFIFFIFLVWPTISLSFLQIGFSISLLLPW